MNPKLLVGLALVLSGVLLGCSSVTRQSQTVKVSVIGSVKAPGDYVLPKGSSIVGALEAAGGFTDVGPYALVVVRMVNGQKKNFSVRLRYDSGKPKADFEVIDGDAIYVRYEFL